MAFKFSRVYSISSELNASCSISSIYDDILRDRLAITFIPIHRQTRGRISLTKHEHQRRYEHKKAQKVYLDVLNFDPHIFIPFALAVSPRLCISAGKSVTQLHRAEKPLCLKQSDRVKLEAFARERNFSENDRFTALLDALFPKARPITDAGHGYPICFEFGGASLIATRSLFGESIANGIDEAQLREKSKSPTLNLTECAKANFSKRGFQDAIITLTIGNARKLASIFYPSISENVFVAQFLEEHAANDAGTTISQALMRNKEIDAAYFTFRGASVAAIAANFNPSLFRAVEESQLRVWEKNQLLIETTDCIVMKIFRQPPHHGTMHIRMAFDLGIEIVNALYKDSST